MRIGNFENTLGSRRDGPVFVASLDLASTAASLTASRCAACSCSHSHPFVQRLIGTVRREYLNRTLSWTTADLKTKLLDFQQDYNAHRTHAGLEGRLQEPALDGSASPIG